MIGRKEWFTRRKYSGWGLTPKSWQGVAYIAAIVAIGFLINGLPIPSGLKMAISVVFIVCILIDILHIMATVKIDEREAKIEALAERNASWTMVGTLGILIIYFSTVGDAMSGKDLIPFLLIPVIAGLIVKAASAFILQKKEL